MTAWCLSRIGGQSEIASEIWIGRASALRLIGSLREYNVGMSKEIVSIPGCLSEWIEQNMPELGGMGGVRILCCDRLPFQWVPGFMPNIVGITLWNTIYLRRTVCPIDPNDPAGTSLLFHELVHEFCATSDYTCCSTSESMRGARAEAT